MLKKLLGVIRSPFLLLTPVCLAPAFAQVYADLGVLDPVTTVLILVGAICAHIAVNALNEYEDFRSGLDFSTEKTPFSGGSGTLVDHPEFAPVALFAGWLALLVTFSIGLYFLRRIGSEIVVPGLVGVAIVVTYTRWLNRFPLLCLIAPGAGFGLLFINLSILVLTGEYSVAGFWLSLVVTLLVGNLLLINQFPDIEADRRVGRNHAAIAWGLDRARGLSAGLLSAVYVILLAGWGVGAVPLTVLLAWLTLPLAVWVHRDLRRYDGSHQSPLLAAMGKNLALTLLTPLLMAAGVLMAGA